MRDRITLLVRIGVALILLQTLFFKFSRATESVYIFSSLGIEPVGRIGSGVVELIAAILLFVPNLIWLGAGLALGVISVAILSHLTVLGIVVLDDGGTLFALALIVFVGSVYILWTQRLLIPIINKYIK
jgi:uncharacterized membrane protein YphA (DoxX/SURF4 family)